MEKTNYLDHSSKPIEEGFYQNYKDGNKIYYFTGNWRNNNYPLFKDFDGKGTIVLSYDHVGELIKVDSKIIGKLKNKLKNKVKLLEEFLE